MSGDPTWSEADIQAAQAILSSGGTHTDVGERFGISRCAAVGRCQRAGVFVKNIRPMKHRYHGQEVVDEVLALRAQGRPWSEIARRSNVGKSTAEAMVRRMRPKLAPDNPILSYSAAMRAPMPPGDLSWDLITTGTLLDGASFHG